MKTYYDCLPCFLRQTIEAARMVTDKPEVQEKILRTVLAEMVEMDLNETPPYMAQRIHNHVKKAAQNDDPYKEIKNKFNQAAMEFYEELSQMMKKSADPFSVAVKIAIAGNIIDFGVRGDISEEEVWQVLQNCLKEPLVFNQASELKLAVQESKNILYLGDNAGEIVFDRLLLEQVPNDKITFAVKGKPIINDATMEDAVQTGLTKLVRVIENGSDAPGTILETCSPEFKEAFARADLIIAKGQANYETLSQITGKKVFFLLKAKCPVIAYDLGCHQGDLVLKKHFIP